MRASAETDALLVSVVDCDDGCQKENQEEAEADEESHAQVHLQQKSGQEKICREEKNSEEKTAEEKAGAAAGLE